jgi:hypothetical protein
VASLALGWSQSHCAILSSVVGDIVTYLPSDCKVG